MFKFCSLGFYSLLFILSLINPFKVFGTTPSQKFSVAPRDSLRSTIKNGIRALVYSIEGKETFYSIARKYHLEPKTLIEFNPDVKTLTIGQEILIPREKLTLANKNGIIGAYYMVKKGETIYSIAKDFGFTQEYLAQVNNIKNNSVQMGQKLIIPSKTGNKNPSIAKIEIKPNGHLIEIPNDGLYTVSAGETIYSIGFKYGVSVDEIRKYNQIQNNEIKIGQTLKLREDANSNAKSVVGEKSKSDTPLFKPSDPSKINTENINPKNSTQANLNPNNSKPTNTNANNYYPNSTNPGNSNPVSSSSTTNPISANPINPNLPVKVLPPTVHRSRANPREFKEDGMGIWVESNDLNQARTVALHKQAPIGTVIKVSNPMTRKSIFVKVVGSFPETEETKNAVIVISKSAANLIGALDPHFRVNLSYAY